MTYFEFLEAIINEVALQKSNGKKWTAIDTGGYKYKRLYELEYIYSCCKGFRIKPKVLIDLEREFKVEKQVINTVMK